MSSTIGAGLVLRLVLLYASNAVAWHMVSKSTTSASASASASSSPTSPASLSDLRSAVWKIALFYTLWALYNRCVLGREQKVNLGSFGILLLACFLTAQFGSSSNGIATRIPLVLSCGLVARNYVVVLLSIPMAGSPSALAIVFTAYIVSSVVLWCYCSYLFYKLPLEAADEGGYGYGSIVYIATNTDNDIHAISTIEEVEISDV